jgi:hypothetical protein
MTDQRKVDLLTPTPIDHTPAYEVPVDPAYREIVVKETTSQLLAPPGSSDARVPDMQPGDAPPIPDRA